MLNSSHANEQVEKMMLLYEFHIVREKLRLFEKKYGKSFEEFEIEVKKKEDFEKWDDYMEWKAYLKAYEDLKKVVTEK